MNKTGTAEVETFASASAVLYAGQVQQVWRCVCCMVYS